jgi:hypothetical protein
MKNRQPGQICSRAKSVLGIRRIAAFGLAATLTIGASVTVVADTDSSGLQSITGSSQRGITGSSQRGITGSSQRGITGSSQRGITGSSQRGSTGSSARGAASFDMTLPVTLIGAVSGVNGLLGTIQVGGVDVFVESANIEGSIGIGSIVYITGTQTGNQGLVLADSIETLAGDYVGDSGENLMGITGSSKR